MTPGPPDEIRRPPEATPRSPDETRRLPEGEPRPPDEPTRPPDRSEAMGRQELGVNLQ